MIKIIFHLGYHQKEKIDRKGVVFVVRKCAYSMRKNIVRKYPNLLLEIH